MNTISDLYLTDRQEIILLMVRERKTFQEIADANDVSIKTIQDDMTQLMEYKLVRNVVNENGKTRMRGRELTGKGKEWLKSHGHHA